jgi:hypothetical protein
VQCGERCGASKNSQMVKPSGHEDGLSASSFICIGNPSLNLKDTNSKEFTSRLSGSSFTHFMLSVPKVLSRYFIKSSSSLAGFRLDTYSQNVQPANGSNCWPGSHDCGERARTSITSFGGFYWWGAVSTGGGRFLLVAGGFYWWGAATRFVDAD